MLRRYYNGQKSLKRYVNGGVRVKKKKVHVVGRLIPNFGSARCWLLLSHHTHGDSLCRTRAHTSSHRAPRGIAGPLPEAAPARKGARGDIHQRNLSGARPGSRKEKKSNSRLASIFVLYANSICFLYAN